MQPRHIKSQLVHDSKGVMYKCATIETRMYQSMVVEKTSYKKTHLNCSSSGCKRKLLVTLSKYVLHGAIWTSGSVLESKPLDVVWIVGDSMITIAIISYSIASKLDGEWKIPQCSHNAALSPGSHRRD